MKIVSAPIGGSAQVAGKCGHLTHAVEIDDRNNILRVMCSRVKAEHILEDWSLYDLYEVDCKSCQRAVRKAAA